MILGYQCSHCGKKWEINVKNSFIENGVPLYTCCDECDRARRNLKTSNWISVKDRLPESDDDILVYQKERKTDNMEICLFHYGSTLDADEIKNYCITHWMPLPEMPEGEE